MTSSEAPSDHASAATTTTTTSASSNQRKRQVCIFGSSANPPTGDQGHVGIVRALTRLNRFDEIRVVPVYSHPFSTKRKQLAPFEHRLCMCQLAFENGRISSNVVVSNAEERIYHQKAKQQQQQQQDQDETISVGTADLLEYFQHQQYPNNEEECTLCLGADTFLDLMSGKWRRTQDILGFVQGRFVVLYRKEDDENVWEQSVIQEEHILLEDHNNKNNNKQKDTPYDTPQYVQLQQAIQQLNETYGQNGDQVAQLLHIPTLGSVSSTLIRTLSSASSLGNFNSNANNDSSRHSSSDNNNNEQQQQRADEYLKRSVPSPVFEYMVQHELYGFSRAANDRQEDMPLPTDDSSSSSSTSSADEVVENGAASSSSSSWTKNFLVMSDTGKPIFAQYGTEEEVAKICGLLQAIRFSIGGSSENESLGDIRSLRSGNLCMVFMIVNALTLVAIGSDSDSEAYLKLQLEYIFAQIIFTVTEKVQTHYTANPSFDLRSLLGNNTDSILQNILEESSATGNHTAGQYLVGGIESLFPFSPVIRSRASSVLKVVGLQTDFTIFALLVVGEKVLSIIQPDFPSHQMKISDLHLLLKFINRQPGLLSSELWIPVCLPRFSSQDFLFCYTQCLDAESKLCLIFVSQQGTPEQFNLFRGAAAKVRQSLELSPQSESVLEILEPSESQDLESTTEYNDVRWKRSRQDDVDHHNEDYVDASGDADEMIPYIASNRNDNPLLREIKTASDPDTQKKLLEQYAAIGSASHFLFRINVPLQTSVASCKFAQCISSPLGFPFVDIPSKQRVWNMYQKLGLRLRLGSALAESTTDAFDMITQDHIDTTSNDEGPMAPGIGRYCPAISLFEAQANDDGIAYVLDESELFFAMNGPDFDLYMVLSSTLSLKQAAALGAKLARSLLADQKNLFLTEPLTWDG